MADSKLPPAFKVVGLRTEKHGERLEELALTAENAEEVFEKMRTAVMAEVRDPHGNVRTAMCREVRGQKTVLLVEPLNARATAETLTLRTFATRYRKVVVSYNDKT